MKFFDLGVFVALASLSIIVVAEKVYTLADITPCSLSCVAVVAPANNCAATDFKCQCRKGTTEDYAHKIASCLLANCTMHDEWVAAKIQADVCGQDHPNRSAGPLVTTIVVFAIVTVLLILRFFSKVWIHGGLGLDDWMLVVAYLLGISSTILVVKMTKLGFGKHLWDIPDGNVAIIMKYLYVVLNQYVVSMALTKISLVLLYLRLFQHDNSFRYAAHATIGFILVSTTILWLISIFVCSPVPYFWDRDIKGSKCLNIRATQIAVGSMSIAQDLIIIALPMPILYTLNMSTKKKFGVGFMLLVGSFGCIVSMIRLKALAKFGSSIEPTWQNIDAVIWTTLETGACMICVSLPSVRALFVHLFHGAKAKGQSSSSGSDPSSISRGARSSRALDPWVLELRTNTMQQPNTVLVELGGRGHGQNNKGDSNVMVSIGEVSVGEHRLYQ